MTNTIGGMLLIVGSAFILLAAIGVVRFEDIYARMHAAAKAPALGVICIGVGASMIIESLNALIVAVLVVVLQLISGPVGAHILARSVYRRLDPRLDGPDELARDEAHQADAARDGDDS
jgi:multicomponent Na+:H+ antiporter subunit G